MKAYWELESEGLVEGRQDVGTFVSRRPVARSERVCGHLILLTASWTQLCDGIDDVLATHRMLLGPRRNIAEVEPTLTVIKSTQTARQTRLLVRLNGAVIDPAWEVTEVGLEDIILAYMEHDDSLSTEMLPRLGVAR